MRTRPPPGALARIGFGMGTIVALHAPPIAAAQPAPLPEVHLSPPPEPESNDGRRLSWTYPRARAWQIAGALGVSAASVYLQFGMTGAFPDNDWTEGLLFDDAARDALVAESKDGRKSAAQISNWFWWGAQAYPILIDSLLVPLATDRLNTEVALEMTLINWQVQGLTFMLTRLSHRTAGRSRPSLQECDKDRGYDSYCNPDSKERTGSFIGGHVAMAASGAGLVCAHHQALPLYGGNFADGAVCGLAIASAGVTGTLRLVADKHWTSDVLVGAALGGTIGYGLPWLLHYRHGQKPRALGAELLPDNMYVLPMASDREMGMAVHGLF